MKLTRRAFLLSPLFLCRGLIGTGLAAVPINPGSLLIKRKDGLLYPFSGQHPFVGVATTEAGDGESVEYVRIKD